MNDENRPADDFSDDDFFRIVAGLELSVPEEMDEVDPAHPGDEPGTGDAHDDAGETIGNEQDVFEPRWSDPLGEDHLDDEDRFVPPDPGPMPPLDAVSRAAWSVLIGAPAVLVLAVLVAWQPPRSVTGLLVLGFVGALVALLVRRGNINRGDDPDDGAVL